MRSSLILLILGLAAAITSGQNDQNLCQNVPKLWSCANNKAMFNAVEAKKVFYVTVPGSLNSLDIVFKASENIKEVDISSADLYGINSVGGPNLEKVTISGPKDLKTLCIFLDTKNKLPQMEKVVIKNAEIFGLLGSQDCGSNEVVVPLHPHDLRPKTVEVKKIAIFF